MNPLNPFRGDLEMFKFDLGIVIQDQEQKAILNQVLAWISEGATPEERERRLNMVQEFARKEMGRIQAGN